MKKSLTLIITLVVAQFIAAQTGLKGIILDEETGQPAVGVTVTLANQNLSTTTNQNGEFALTYLASGEEELLIEADGYNSTVELLQLQEGQTNDIGTIRLQPDIIKEQQDEILLNLAEQDLNDDEGRTQDQASAASSSQDVFNNLTGFAWSSARYRHRGYEATRETNYIEGISFNTSERNSFNFSAMGGLNDASRYKETVNPMESNNFTFGGLGRSTNYLMSASHYAQGWKVGVAGTNRNYKAVARATYASGPLANGWSFAGQLAFRFGPYTQTKGQIGEGIDYYSLGYFFTAERNWNNRHRLSIITFGSPTQRGQSAGVTQEAYYLTNQYNKTQWGWNNYNPYWGWQDGKMRNSRIVKSFDPTAIVGYEYKIDDCQKIHVGVGFHYSLYSNSALTFYNAPDPRPDYYRNMPSFLWDGQLDQHGNYITKDNSPSHNILGEGFTNPYGEYVGPTIDQSAYSDLYNRWTTRDDATTQINWNALYAANYAQNAQDAITGKVSSARYMQERRHNDICEAMVSFNYQNTQYDHLKMTLGVEAKESIGKHYKTVDDMLGGNQWIDVDPFAERDIKELATNIGMSQTAIEVVKQNDVGYWSQHDYQAKQVKTGDRFGYDYDITMTNAKVWFQNEWKWRNLDLYYALQLTYSNMQRTSKMLNGRAFYLSLLHDGMAEYYLGQKGFDVMDGKYYNKYVGFAHHFVDPAFKAGLTYKINGRNRILFNALAMTQAPLARDAYISPRVHDRAVENIYTHDRAKNLKDYFCASEKIVGGDLTYEFNFPIVRGRITGFYSRMWDGTELNGFYDDEARTFVNQSMTGIDRRHCGIEAALSVKMGTYFTLTGATSVGDYSYTDNADVVTSAENGMALGENKSGAVFELVDKAYIKGLKVATGPQVNASLKLSFFHPDMWFADITLSYFDWNWLDYAPSRRMQSLYTGYCYDTEGNKVNVNGGYYNIYIDNSASFNAIRKDEQGNIVTDKYGTPELISPYNQLANQESLVSNNPLNRFMLDCSFGKLIYLPNRQSLSINLSVTNLTNNVHFKTGGYQQARLPRGTRQGVAETDGNSTITSNVWKFPSKYYYAWGTNFYLTVTYKF